MPKEDLGQFGSNENLRAAGKRAGVGRTTLTRPRPSQPRDRLGGTRRLHDPGGVGLGLCGTGSVRMLRRFEGSAELDIQYLRCQNCGACGRPLESCSPARRARKHLAKRPATRRDPDQNGREKGSRSGKWPHPLAHARQSGLPGFQLIGSPRTPGVSGRAVLEWQQVRRGQSEAQANAAPASWREPGRRACKRAHRITTTTRA